MSILFHKKSRKIVKGAFAVVAVLIALSMVLLYAPGFWQ